MTSRNDDDRRQASLFRQIAKSAISEAVSKARTTAVLAGTVEDLSEDLDVVYVRMDREALGGDPTQSDNFGFPGMVPTTRLGETYVGEQVRVSFDGSAGGSAMQTSVPTRRVFPYGAETGQRTIQGGAPGTGYFTYYDDNDVQVGYQSPVEWSVGTPGSAMARLSPLGGIRLRDLEDILRVILSPYEGLIFRDPVSGISGLVARHDGLTVLDPVTGEELTISTGAQSATPTPKWASSIELSPGTSHDTPAIDGFGTTKDLVIRFVAASDPTDLGVQSYTSPAGHTERTDVNSSGSGLTLATSAATQVPVTDAALASFTNTTGAWDRANGHTVIVRGGGPVDPSFLSANTEDILTSAKTIGFDIDKPASVAEGHMLAAFVALAGPAIPVDWTVPDGWEQLGVQVAGAGTSHVLASGVWAKLATASEPAFEHVEIIMSTGALTRVQATVVAIQDPFAFTSGLDIRLGGVSIGRRPAVIPTLGVVQPGPLLSGYVNSSVPHDASTVIYRGSRFAVPAGPVVRVSTVMTTGAQSGIVSLREANSGIVTGTATVPANVTRGVYFEWLHGLNLDTATAQPFTLEIRARRGVVGGANPTLYNPVTCEFVDVSLAPNADANGNPVVSTTLP